MSSTEEARYCIRCGGPLSLGEWFGKLRPYCPACGWIYFADPKVAVAVLITHDHQILLGRRVNEPGRGQWTLPAGFVDAGEDPREAARRECLEETGLEVEIGDLLDVLYGQEHERGAHILIVYQARILCGAIRASDDVDAVDFFDLDHLPSLAFSTTQKILQKWQEKTCH
ncbi:MAG: DNA mismatch repair protein MutT [Anaerolineae bacterium]|jgi:ADP-ribose pyrophosphatase YjhB (NUDIX family)|nr:MAG: DNA mismatch repair protein MutT [Anaerolineae bacterium]